MVAHPPVSATLTPSNFPLFFAAAAAIAAADSDKGSESSDFDGDAEESDPEDAPATTSPSSSPRQPRSNHKASEKMQRRATLAEARKKYLSKTERQKQAAAQAVLDEEMPPDEFTEEEKAKMEEIQAMFDTNTDERLDVKEEDHRILIEKLKKKHAPVKQKLYEEASRELQQLKDEARRRRDMEKAKLEAASKPKPQTDVPVLGRAFNSNNDVDLSSDSDFEFESEGKRECETFCRTGMCVGRCCIENERSMLTLPLLTPAHTLLSDAPPSLDPTFSSSTAKAPRLSLTTQAKTLPVASRKVMGHTSKRNKIKELLRVKTRAKGNAWLANELEYTSVDDHINDCKIVEVRRREKFRRDELKEEIEAARIAKLRAEGKEIDDEGGSEKEEMDEEEMMMMKKDEEENEEEEEEEEEEEVVEDIATQMELEFEQEAADDTTPLVQKKTKTTPLEKVMGPVKATSAEPVEMTEPTTEPAVGAVEDAMNVDGTEAETTGPSTVAAKAATEAAAVGEDAVEQSTADKASDDADADDEEEEFDADAAEEDAPKKDRAAAYKAMLLRDEANAKKKKRMMKGLNSLVEEEADEEEEEDAVAGLEDFGFGTKKVGEEDEEKAAGLDTITADDLENIVDTFSDDEGDEEEGDKKRALQAAAEEKKAHKEMMRRMKEGYDGRRHGTAGAARGGLDWNTLVAADGKKDAKRLGLLNSDEEDSDDEKDGSESEEEDELALLDRVLKERHNPRNQLAHQLASDSEESSDEESDAEGDADEEADKAQAREEERLAKRIAKRAKMQRVLAEFGGEFSQSQSQSMLCLPEDDEDEMMKKDLSMIKTSKNKGGFLEEFGGGEESQSASNFATTVGLGDEKAHDSSRSLFSRLSKPPLNKRKADAEPLNDSTNDSAHLKRASSSGSSESALNVNGALAMALKASRKVGNKKFKSNFLGRNGEEGSKLGRSSSANRRLDL